MAGVPADVPSSPQAADAVVTDRGRVFRQIAGQLAVLCWCERRIIHVPKQWVLDGKTGSCGRRGCSEPVVEERVQS